MLYFWDQDPVLEVVYEGENDFNYVPKLAPLTDWGQPVGASILGTKNAPNPILKKLQNSMHAPQNNTFAKRSLQHTTDITPTIVAQHFASGRCEGVVSVSEK